MARPIKTTADWFKFLHGFPSSSKMIALRHHYKNRGAIILIYIWDYLLGQENQCTPYNEATLDVWAINFDEDAQFIRDVINCCLKYKLLQLDKLDNIYSEDLNELLSGLHEKRKRDRERQRNSSRSDNGSSRSDNDNFRNDNGSSRSDNDSFRSDNDSFRYLKRRVEKRREEYNTPLPPQGGNGGKEESGVVGFDNRGGNGSLDNRGDCGENGNPVGYEKYDLSFIEEPFHESFYEFLEYKRSEQRFIYNSERSIKTCYNRLIELSGGNPQIASEIVKQAISNGWKGIFKLEKNNYGTGNNNNGYRTAEDLRQGAARIISSMSATGQQPETELPVV